MVDITLSPPPGTYATEQSISATADSQYTSVLFTTDGSAPTLAKYIAYDNLTPQNPFIAVVQDGKGNAVFDGGFPKWYNDVVNPAWTTFSEMSGSFKYFYNALNFIANKTKVTSGNKKVLILGDLDSGNYCIKDVAAISTSGFKSSIDKVCAIAGYIPTYKTLIDYGGILNPTYAELDTYCCVVVMSTAYATTKLISDVAVSNISAYREAGNGIFVITDHGVGADGFYKTANYIVANLGVMFDGNYDRTSMNVGYLRATYGDHPLYANLLNTENISAGGSESRVIVTQSPVYTYNTIPSFLTGPTGIHTFRFLLMCDDGSMTTKSFTYAVNITEPLQYTKGGLDVTSISTFSHAYTLTFRLDNVSFGTGTALSGLIKHNGAVIGTFSGTSGAPVYNFYSGSNNLTLPTGSNTMELELQVPVAFFKTLPVTVEKCTTTPISMSKLTARLNKYELAMTNPHMVIKAANAKLGLSRKINAVSHIKILTDYMK